MLPRMARAARKSASCILRDPWLPCAARESAWCIRGPFCFEGEKGWRAHKWTLCICPLIYGECTTPDNVQRPRRRLRNTPPPRPCQQTRPQRRAAPHLPRAARTRPQPKGAASQPPEMPTTSRTRRPLRPRSSLPPAASASRGWATSPCSCSPPRASPYAWPCRWPVPPGSWPFLCHQTHPLWHVFQRGWDRRARLDRCASFAPVHLSLTFW